MLIGIRLSQHSAPPVQLNLVKEKKKKKGTKLNSDLWYLPTFSFLAGALTRPINCPFWE